MIFEEEPPNCVGACPFSFLLHIVNKFVAANPKSVEDYKAGKDRAIGFLVGQVMKETHGKANPGIVNKFLLEILNK